MSRLRAAIGKLELTRGAPVPAVEMHSHTSWTDGAQTVGEMFAKAVDVGMESLNFSEHARRTSGDWFGQFAEQVRALPQDQCRTFVGVEAKIDDLDGNLDIIPEITGLCDLVMASVHRFPGEADKDAGTRSMSPEQAVDMEFRLMCAALDNPGVDILGHPFGMTFRRFGCIPPEDKFIAVIEKAAKTGVAFEVNARYHPDPWQLIDWCREVDAVISLGSNAHNTEELGQLHRILNGHEDPWNPSESLLQV